MPCEQHFINVQYVDECINDWYNIIQNVLRQVSIDYNFQCIEYRWNPTMMEYMSVWSDLGIFS